MDGVQYTRTTFRWPMYHRMRVRAVGHIWRRQGQNLRWAKLSVASRNLVLPPHNDATRTITNTSTNLYRSPAMMPRPFPPGSVRHRNVLTPRLGSGESGKSTIVKQMKIIHQNGYKTDELMAYRPTIYKNLLDSAHHIILAMRQLGKDCVDPTNRARTEKILDYQVSSSATFLFSEEMAKAIFELWKDPIIPSIMDHSSEFYLMDSAS